MARASSLVNFVGFVLLTVSHSSREPLIMQRFSRLAIKQRNTPKSVFLILVELSYILAYGEGVVARQPCGFRFTNGFSLLARTADNAAVLTISHQKERQAQCLSFFLVELSGFEPLASSLRTRRSTN